VARKQSKILTPGEKRSQKAAIRVELKEAKTARSAAKKEVTAASRALAIAERQFAKADKVVFKIEARLG